MKAQYTDPSKYSVRLPDGTVVPRLLEYDWKRLGIDVLEAEGEIAEYVPPKPLEPYEFPSEV